MKRSKLLLLSLMIFPWLTIPLLGKKIMNRFIPSALFMSILVWIESYIAKRYRWWWFYEKVNPRIIGEFPLIVGPFLIGTLWIMKFTYGKFIRFTIANLIVDSFFTYIMVEIFKKLRIANLIRLSKVQLSLLFFLKSMILYGFQYILEKTKLIKGL